jgi:hypothetical protein
MARKEQTESERGSTWAHDERGRNIFAPSWRAPRGHKRVFVSPPPCHLPFSGEIIIPLAASEHAASSRSPLVLDRSVLRPPRARATAASAMASSRLLLRAATSRNGVRQRVWHVRRAHVVVGRRRTCAVAIGRGALAD